MKKFKKILALALSLAMVLGMSVTTFASSNDELVNLSGSKPTKNDKGKITILGLKTGDTVNIYKIVKANYSDSGFIGYESVHKTAPDTPMIDDVEAPLVTEIASLLAHVKKTGTDEHTNCCSKDGDQYSDTQTLTAENNGTAEFTDLTVGTYLVEVVAGNGSTTVYNPMVASVYYKTDNNTDKLHQGSIDVTTAKWTIANTTAYAKSSDDNDITKTIENSDRSTSATGYGKGDDVAANTTVSFAIAGTIPSYDPQYYTNPTYVITDELSPGLDFVEVKGETEDENKTAEQVLQEKADIIFGKTGDVSNAKVNVNGRIFTITLSADYLKGLAGCVDKTTPVDDDAAITDRTFKFGYSAVLNGSAYNFDASTNTAKVSYSNKPGTGTGADPTKDGEEHKTYHYTFAIGANLSVDEEVTNYNIKTDIIKKIDADGNVTDLQQTITPGQTTSTTNVKPLPGATFELRQGTKVIGSTDTDPNGGIMFTGLDAGEYTLVETKAPAGYSLEGTKEYPVKIEATYHENGTLDEVKITIDGATNIYKGNYTGENGKLASISISRGKLPSETGDGNVDNETIITYVKNTTLAALPSTGGIGTTIFTIGGCAIMILAAGLYFASRRRSAK